MDTSLSKHGVVFDLAFAQGRAVVGNQNELGLALAQSFQRCFVSKRVLRTGDCKVLDLIYDAAQGLEQHHILGRGPC